MTIGILASPLLRPSFWAYCVVAITSLVVQQQQSGLVEARTTFSHWLPSVRTKPSSSSVSFVSKKTRRQEQQFHNAHPPLTTIPNAQFLVTMLVPRGGSASSGLNNNLSFPSEETGRVSSTERKSSSATLVSVLDASEYVQQTPSMTGGHLNDTDTPSDDDDNEGPKIVSNESNKAFQSFSSHTSSDDKDDVVVDGKQKFKTTETRLTPKQQKKAMKAQTKAKKKVLKQQKKEIKLKNKEIQRLSKLAHKMDHVDRKAKPTDVIVKEQQQEIKHKDKVTKKLHKQIAKKLKNRNATNKRRKFMHCTWGILFATLNNIVPRAYFLPGMSFLTGLTLFLELARYRDGFEWINRGFSLLFGKALRKSEMEGRFTGSLYYFSGVLLSSYVYPKPCATLGIIQLAVADPTASYFGRATRHVYWSRINNGFCWGLGRNKGLLGFLGGAVSCVPFNYRIVRLATRTLTHEISRRTVLVVSCALGFAGAFADLIVPTPALTLPKTIKFPWNDGRETKLPPFHVDDNFIVPLLSGVACMYIFQLAGIPIDVPLNNYLIV